MSSSIACRNTARAKREQAVEYEENSRDYNNIMGEAEELEEMATEADNFCNQLSS